MNDLIKAKMQKTLLSSILLTVLLFSLTPTLSEHNYTIYGNDCYVKIKDVTSRNNFLYITYEYINNSNKKSSFMWSFSVDIFQDGYECDQTFFDDASKNSSTDIKDGAKLEVIEVYKLRNNDSLVEISIDKYLSWSSNPTVIYYNPKTKNWGTKSKAEGFTSSTTDNQITGDEWKCPDCGKILTSKFCPDCGTTKPTPVPSPTPSPTLTADPAIWVCPNCKKELTTKFCPDCGTTRPIENKEKLSNMERKVPPEIKTNGVYYCYISENNIYSCLRFYSDGIVVEKSQFDRIPAKPDFDETKKIPPLGNTVQTKGEYIITNNRIQFSWYYLIYEGTIEGDTLYIQIIGKKEGNVLHERKYIFISDTDIEAMFN